MMANFWAITALFVLFQAVLTAYVLFSGPKGEDKR